MNPQLQPNREQNQEVAKNLKLYSGLLKLLKKFEEFKKNQGKKLSALLDPFVDAALSTLKNAGERDKTQIIKYIKQLIAVPRAFAYGLGNLATLGVLKSSWEGFKSVYDARRLWFGINNVEKRVEMLYGQEGVQKFKNNLSFRFGSRLGILRDRVATIPLAGIFGVSGAISGLGSTLTKALEGVGVPKISEWLIKWGEKSKQDNPIARVVTGVPELFDKILEQLLKNLKNLQSAKEPSDS